MPVVSISEASRLSGVARSTLYRGNKQGKLSFITLPDGQPGIDTSELYRVYPPQALHSNVDTEAATAKTGDTDTATTRRIAELQLELRLVREQLTATQERESWLQSQVNNLIETVRMIEHRPADPPRGFLARLFGRS